MVTTPAHPKVESVESTIVFPKQECKEVVTAPLSVVDAVVTHYGPCSAVWFFNPCADTKQGFGPGNSVSEVCTELKTSLALALSDFPHFAGHLAIVKHVPNGDHTQRLFRLQVTYGAPADPGVQFDIARCDDTLDSIIPDSEFHARQYWSSSTLTTGLFLPDQTKLPFMTLERHVNPQSPAMIQVTEFACGGISVGVMISHALADAQTLSLFMHRWSYQHARLFSSEIPHVAVEKTDVSPLKPLIFNPQLVDQRATGDIDGSTPDPATLEISRSLPSMRYDYFYPAPDGDPDRFLPPEITRDMLVSPGKRMPHEDWDRTVPLSHVKLHFSAEQVKQIQAKSGDGVSYHDAILAHVWRAVNRARGRSDDDCDVSLHIIFGLRKRLGLPSSFVGSPILSTTVTTTGREASGLLSLGDIASKINQTLGLYTEHAIGARLHDLCFECCPQRFWEGFLGSKHMIFTSWAHLHLYDVDFGGFRGKARHVDARMPESDGMMWLMEARSDNTGDPNTDRGKSHWCDDGIDVSMNIAAEVGERLKTDTLLWDLAGC